MVISNSVVRIYTPPTCTLKIVGKSSPLARWVGGTVLKKMRFELRFDDPRKHKDQQIKVKGEQEELELLSEVVTEYIQKFLHRSALDLPLLTPEASTLERSFSEVLNNQSEQVIPFPGLDSSEPETEGEEAQTSSLSPPPFARGPRLEPKGLLAHQLYLGYLGSEETGESVALSTTQLFDLATALDEYAEDIVALPFLKDSDRSVIPYWAGTAAAVVMAVGLTAIGMRMLDNSPEAETVADAGSPNTQAPIGIVPPPSAPAVSPTPTPTLPSDLKSKEKQKPPGPVKRGSEGSLTQPGGNTTSGSEVTTVPNQPPRVSNSNQKTIPSVRPAQPAKPPNVAPGATVIKPNLRPAPQEIKPSVPSRNGETPSIPGRLPSLDNNKRVAGAGDDRTFNTPSSTRESPLSDAISQEAEVKSYFQRNWNPPQGFTETLEYRLVLDNDGSLRTITPIGSAANTHIESTNMPKLGLQFVSPFSGGESKTIRLVLYPDSKVATFLEK